MVSEHNNHSDQKEFFLKGYNEMLLKIEPERIICYNEPFPEMQGNVVFVDYTLSSWKYQHSDYVPSKYADCLLGKQPLPSDSSIVIKSGHVIQENLAFKGMGSAFGGAWKPSKPQDERFLGEPGEIKTTINQNGERFETKIGENGKAEKERHYTDHNKPWVHTSPHDHIINWEYPKPGIPNFEKPHINYQDEAPEFKSFREAKVMYTIVGTNSLEENRFKTISDFEDCMIRGGEVEFIVNNKTYDIVHDPNGIAIYEAHKAETECKYQTADDVLDYLVDGIRLRDIITEVEVISRTI